MKFSKYNFLFRSEKYGHLMFNAETKACVWLSEEDFKVLRLIEQDPKNIEIVGEKTKEALLCARIIVENEDQIMYKKRMHYFFNAFDSSNLGLAIAPTTDCNFLCPYCYEANKAHHYMNSDVENKLINFICGHNRVSKLNITWYGGEPLMGFSSIQHILGEVSKIEHLKLCQHTMTTNGYLLDKHKSLFFKQYPLSCVQITVDGTRDFHDTRRVLSPDKSPTFDRIIENVGTFIEINPDTRISIRVNIDHSNEDSFVDLYRQLHALWPGKENLIVYPAFVKDFQSLRTKISEDNFSINGCRDVCFTISDKLLFFEKLHKEFGININFSPEYTVGGCGATTLNYYVVGPQGELYKCWNDIGNPKAVVGSIFADGIITNYDLLSRYIAGPNMFDDEKCMKCKIMTICDGGCMWNRHKNLFENANISLCSSRISNPEKAFELYYEQLLNQQKKEK